MREQSPLEEAAQLFKVLGNASRLSLLLLLGEEERTVGALTRATGMSQPLVSQHLRTLRQTGLAGAVRQGKEVVYHVSDAHVSHVIHDALAHVQEPGSDEEADTERKESTIMTTDTHAEHTLDQHTHAVDCGHEAVQHGDHVDYVHGGHRHALHDDHYDEHEAVAEHSAAEHTHGTDCGHDGVQHDDHIDYLHDDHKHAAHDDHYDEH